MAGNTTLPISLFPLFEVIDNTQDLIPILKQVIDNPLQLRPLVEIKDTSENLRLFVTDLLNKINRLEQRIIDLEAL